jgi:hypothetical protein
MHGTWNMCQQSGRLRTFSPTWKSCGPRREDENSEPLTIEKEEENRGDLVPEISDLEAD